MAQRGRPIEITRVRIKSVEKQIGVLLAKRDRRAAKYLLYACKALNVPVNRERIRGAMLQMSFKFEGGE